MIAETMIIISVIGGLATIAHSRPIDKLITLAIVSGGIVGLIASRGYLDVAAAVAVMIPVSSIIVLTVLVRRSEVEEWT